MTHNLNLVPGKVPVAVHVKQYDTGPREVTFNLYYGDTVYTIPSSVTITVSGTKPDGNGFAYNVTGFSGSTVTVPMQEQMTVLAGEIPCQLTIAQTSGVIGTATFTLCVEPAALSSDTPVSDTELVAFQEMLTQTQQEAAGVAGATAQIATNTSNIATNTAAISQLNSKIVGTDIGVSNAVFRSAGEIVVSTAFNAFEFVDIYLIAQGVALPCIRIFPHKSDINHAITFGYSNPTDNGLRMFAGTFHTAGRYIDSFKLSMSNTSGGAGTVGAWSDVSNSDLLYVRKIIGYNR